MPLSVVGAMNRGKAGKPVICVPEPYNLQMLLGSIT